MRPEPGRQASVCIFAVAVFLIICNINLLLLVIICYHVSVTSVLVLRSDITGLFITSEYAATGLWAGLPLSRDLASRPAPGSQASMCVVVVAVFLFFCIIYFLEMYRYQNFNRYRYRYLKIDLNRYRYLPIPIPRISTNIYR